MLCMVLIQLPGCPVSTYRKLLQPDMMAPTFNPKTWETEQVNLCKSEASLGYSVNKVSKKRL